MVSATFDVTRDRNYPYRPLPSSRQEPPGALARYNAVYAPFQDTGDVTGDGFHDPTDPTRDNPATPQSVGDMLRDTVAVGRSFMDPNWGTAVGTLSGVPGMGAMLGAGVHQFDVSQAAREGDPKYTGSGVPSQQLAGALAQAAAAGRYGLSSPLTEGSWMGMFDAAPAKDFGNTFGGVTDVTGSGAGSMGTSGGSAPQGGDKGPSTGGGAKGEGGGAWYRRGGRVGALRRARSK